MSHPWQPESYSAAMRTTVNSAFQLLIHSICLQIESGTANQLVAFAPKQYREVLCDVVPQKFRIPP